MQHHASPFLTPAGSIEAASNTETSCMQAVQAAVIAAGAAKATAAAAGSYKDSRSAAAVSTGGTAAAGAEAADTADTTAACPPSSFVLDRTERLACSLGRMVGVVQQINEINHDFDILLMAGVVPTFLICAFMPRGKTHSQAALNQYIPM